MQTFSSLNSQIYLALPKYFFNVWRNVALCLHSLKDSSGTKSLTRKRICLLHRRLHVLFRVVSSSLHELICNEFCRITKRIFLDLAALKFWIEQTSKIKRIYHHTVTVSIPICLIQHNVITQSILIVRWFPKTRIKTNTYDCRGTWLRPCTSPINCSQDVNINNGLIISAYTTKITIRQTTLIIFFNQTIVQVPKNFTLEGVGGGKNSVWHVSAWATNLLSHLQDNCPV